MHRRWMRRTAAACAAALICTGCGAPERSRDATEPQASAAPVQAAKEQIFPVTLPDSGLIAEELIRYRGQYWEDGTGDTVENVAGLMLYNPTNRMIEFASFALEEEGQTLYFFVYHLPPMSRCLVLEHDRKTCTPETVTVCRELCIRWDYQELSREQIDYVCLGPLMTVINRDARRQNHVTVWYKRYEKEGDYYLGGAAYSVHIFSLEPEERRTVRPEHYEAGSARIVGIELKT